MASIEERTTSDGKIRYRVQIRLKGYPVQTATFNRKTDAKKWAQQTEVSIKEGRHFKTSESKKHTLGKLIDRYISTILPYKPKNARNQITQLQWWKGCIGYYLLSDITPALIGEFRDKLLKGITKQGKIRSPSTVNRYLAALSHAFTIAVKEWGWLDTSPMKNVMKPKQPRGRNRCLNQEERRLLLEACKASASSYLYTIVVLALSTGMRQGEILNLKWEDIDLDRSIIILNETKNGERRFIPLAGHALDLVISLNSCKVSNNSLLFPSKNQNQPIDIRSAWDNVLKRADIKDFRFHDLRHCAASYLAMNGATLAEISEILGHKTLQMVKRYTHLTESHTTKVVASMNEKIFG